MLFFFFFLRSISACDTYSEAIVNELMSEMKIAKTTFDVVIQVVDAMRRAVEKFIWKTLVGTKQHEMWRLVNG